MKKIIAACILLVFSFASCKGQKAQEKITENLDTIKPQTKVSVKKEYDEYGNLVRIDSTYSSFYSNIKNDSILEKKIFNTFKNNFNNRFHSFDSLFIDDFFNDDPFKLHDFYTDEFFQNNLKLHQKRMQDIFREMDSVKNKFYKKRDSELKKNKI